MSTRKPNVHPLSRAIAVTLAVGLGLGAAQAQAATVTVTSSADPGTTTTCTLRQAITTVNHGATASSDEGNCRANYTGSLGSNDTIVFDTDTFPAGGANTITLAGSRLAISAAYLTIDASANGHVTVDANHASGVMIDTAAAGGRLELRQLTLRNGKVTSADCGGYEQGGAVCIPDADLITKHGTIVGNAAYHGGGIYSDTGKVTLINSTLQGNTAGRSGGGIYTGDGNLRLVGSTVDNNSADYGGAIRSSDGDVTLVNSTLSGNTASWGGAIHASSGSLILSNSTASGNTASYGGAIYSADASISLTNSTLAHNTATRGSAIYTHMGSITLDNATLSANHATLAGTIHMAFPSGTITMYNSIISGNSGGDINGGTRTGDHNLLGSVANLNLGPLADYGGPTKTMLPQDGSATIDAGDDSRCQGADQRGVLRPQGVHCDIGATEAAVPAAITAIWGTNQSTTIWHDFASPLLVQVTGPAGLPAAGVPVHAALAVPGQSGATCRTGITSASGTAQLFCRANGIAGSYSVQVSAADWPAVPSATFVLTNVNDSDTIFRDDFDPPGPSTSTFVAGTAGADFSLHVPGGIPLDQPLP